MGSGSSQDSNSIYFESFFNSDEKPYFIIYPEEQIVNQKIVITKSDEDFFKKKENYLISARTIIEILLNYSIITQEKSQFAVLKKIIIPLFSQYLLTNDQKIINSVLLFKYYKSISTLFLETHNKFLSDFFQSSIHEIVLPKLDINEMYIQNTLIFSKLIGSIISSNNKYYFTFQKSTTKTTNILTFLDIEPTNIKLLVNSFIWSLHTCDLYLLLNTFQKLFLLEKSQAHEKEKQSQSKKNSFYENLPKLTSHQNFSQFFIKLTHEKFNGYINCTEFQFNLPYYKSKHCIIAATPFYLFICNHLKDKKEKEFVKVRIINNDISDNSKRFSHFPTNNFLSGEYGIVICDNVVVFLDQNHNIIFRNSDPDYMKEKVTILPKRSPQLELPFTSDGHFIYSFLSTKEIGVYTVDIEKGVLTFIRKISIKENKNKNKLERPFKDKVIPNKLLDNALLVTNGIVLELIYPEQLENNQFSHFVRVISLSKGKHICDFRFTLPYKLESICFEPFSRSVWGLAIHSEGFCLISYSYNGPDPLWMSNSIMNEKSISIKSISNLFSFNDFAVDFVYSLFIQFFGTCCQSNDLMLSFFVRSASSQMFDFLISLFQLRTNDVKFIQFLFLVLSFQLKFIKLESKQIDSLYDILTIFINNENFFCLLVLFIINLIDYLEISNIPKFFDLIFKSSLMKKKSLFAFYSIYSRCYKSINFPYIFENEKINLIQKLYNNIITNAELELLISYQSSLFRNYSRIFQSNSQLIKKIENEVLIYSSLMFQNVTLVIHIINSIEIFNQSIFISVFKKLIVLLKLTTVSSSFPREILKLLLPFLKVCIQHEKLSLNELNSFFLFFFDIFFLYAQFFKQILTFTDIDLFKKYEQFLDIKIENEKTVSGVFKGQLTDEDFTEIINFLYTKVSNPMNKKLTSEDKQIEKLIFLAIIYQSGKTNEFIEIKKNLGSQIKISQELRQIVQSVYRIRSNLRSKKQKEDQTEYIQSYKNIEEKCHFLLQYTSEKSQDKKISNFINNNIQISEVILTQNRLKDVQINLSMFIQMIDYIFMKGFPKSCLYSFLMYLSENSDILDSFELLIKYVTIDAKKAMSFIQNLLEYFTEMPPNAFLSFISIILIMISKSSKDPHQSHHIITDSLSILFGKMVLKSKDFHKKIYKSSITFLCYFYRILCDENLLIRDENKITVISTLLQETNIKYSMSFTLAHSIMHGTFVPDIFPDVMNIIGLVGEPKFHSLTLLLYEHLLIKAKKFKTEFISDLSQILIIIGSVFCGSTTDKILNIAAPINKLSVSIGKTFCRTPTSQQVCALELVQLIRRLILEKNSEAPSLINDYFKKLTKSVQLEDQQYMKQLYAMLVIMSNIISIRRPNTIINTNENKSYFALSLNEKSNEITGILLPINNQQLVIHKLFASPNIRTTEMIPYNLSLFNNIDIPYSIFELASFTQMKVYSDCLFTFFALECVKENILDSEHGTEFSNKFYKMKIPAINKFIFKTNVPLILSLLKKSLVIPTNGIFVGSPVRPIMFHTSVNQLVFEDDYTLNQKTMEANFCPHIFISSILDDANASYFSIQIDSSVNLCHMFGVVTHSVDQNQLVSITYSSKERAFCINGKRARNFEVKNDCIFECRYLPSKNKVAFATSYERHRCFSCILPEKSRCSFIALMKRNSRNNYMCTMKAQTDCFQKNIHFGQNPIKMLRRFGNKLFKAEIDESVTKFSMLTLDDKEEDSLEIVKYSKEMIEQGETTNEIISSPIISPNSTNSFPTFKDLRETDILLTEYPNYTILPKNHSIYSSPQKLPNYYQVYDVSGNFDLVPSSSVMFEQSNFVPPFHFENFYHLPAEVINCYFSGVCELHRSEILTLYFSRIITNSSDVFASLKNFSINTSMIVYFISNVLLLLEPIKMSNLVENKSPIDFDSFNGFETCAKIEMFDYFTCLTKIIRSFETQKRYEFIKAWFMKLDKDFHNKYMHFATSRNSRLILMNTSIVDKTQTFCQDDVSGWLIFPMKFGFTMMPTIHTRNLVYPSSFSNYSTYAYSRGNQLSISIRSYDDFACGNITYGLLPFCEDSNESLFYSFYQLAISFKYFVLFSYKDLNESQKLHLISFLFDSIVAGSPFFYSHCDEIFSFLKNKINLSFSPDYITILNVFIASVHKLDNEAINHFVNEQISLFDDAKASVFRYFISDSEKVPRKITLPKPVIPHTITTSTFNPSTFMVLMSRVLLNKTRNESFPYHLILNEWSYSFSLFPQCELNFVESNILQIKFTAFVPSSFRLIDQDYNQDEIVYVSSDGDFIRNYTQTTLKNIAIPNSKSGNKVTILDKAIQKLYVMFPNQETASQRNLIVVSNNLADSDAVPELAYKCRSYFKNDINEFTENFTIDDDQHILMKVNVNRFTENKISTRLWPGLISTLDTRVHKPHILFLRAIYLIALNFVCLKNPSLMNKTSFAQFRPFISVLFSMNRFLQLIDESSGSNYVNLHINRQAGLDVRNGLSKNINKSMIGQFTHYYMPNKQHFMNKEKPFYVVFLNENGIDAGGLRRELASELVKDINEPRIGLFIKTPNARNHEGKYQECMIPSPDPAISNSWCFYQAIGALISIGIRSRLQQPDLLFPPFFWNFLVTGTITIDDIYSIDKSYKAQTTNILSASRSMTDEEFEREFSSVSFLNSRGNQIKVGILSGLFTSRKIKKENCERIIAECNEARLNELRIPLQNIRNGFWENMNINQPLFVTPNLIELLACGDRIISAEKLKNALSFDWGVPMVQKRYIKEVIDRMTNDQRRKLIQFSTGLSTLSDNKINVDFLPYPVDQRLPSSSTCFFKLHLPPFSSAEKMYNALEIAINEAGTFENS